MSTQLLQGEEIKFRLHPHPFAYFKSYVELIALLAFSIIVVTHYQGFLSDELRAQIIMIVVALVALGGFVIEAKRRAHSFIVTNYRLITQYKMMRYSSRELTYDKISDLVLAQGVAGRIFNFGTVIPITASGLGTGADLSGSGLTGTIGVTSRIGVGGFAGRGSSTTVPRGRSAYELFNISKPQDVRKSIAELIHDYLEVPHLRNIETMLSRGQTLTESFSLEKTTLGAVICAKCGAFRTGTIHKCGSCGAYFCATCEQNLRGGGSCPKCRVRFR